MVPRSTCSLINSHSSCSSICNKCIFWLIRVAGAPGFNSIVWSHNCFGGNFFDSWSLNMWACFWYCGGMKFLGSVVLGTSIARHTMVCDIGLICRGRNRAFATSGLRSTMGSWSWEIHPRAQSIFGWVAMNQGYPKMTLFSLRSNRKY